LLQKHLCRTHAHAIDQFFCSHPARAVSLVSAPDLLVLPHSATHQAKVALFRVDQLKEVLQQLNLSRNGRKDDLAKRLLEYFTDVAHL
jgi:hypothetical protein